MIAGKRWLTRLIVAGLLMTGLAGCASVRLERLDATLRAYERALRWSDFKAAFALAGNADAPVPDFQSLKDVHVTSYDKVESRALDTEGTKIAQVVEIRYVNARNMSERVISDRQTWAYTESDQRWRLTTPFPVFR